MHPYSTSRLEDLNHCPRFGVVHAQKRYESSARAMALEAGEVMHQVFAAIRIWQLEHKQKLPKHAREVAHRIFGAQRWSEIIREVHATDERDALLELAFVVLHTSGFYDDANDDIRTIGNMELAAIQYVDEMLPQMATWPIYVQDRKDPKSFVGVEITFDVVLEYEDGKRIRFIGTIDGICYSTYHDALVLQENKTASRLDDAWRLSFDMRHQVTGYLAAGTSVIGERIERTRVIGVKIRPSARGENIAPIDTTREREDQYQAWGRWVYNTVQIYERWKDDFEHADLYTTACNRYFRPCSLIGFCTDTPEGRSDQWQTMIEAPLSPSERAVQETS